MKAANQLRKFRQQCEREAGTSADQIEVPLAHVLDDVCRTLNLPTRQHRRVVGRKGYVKLEDTRDMQVDLARPESQ
jgi:hypothetical protein